jgi:hypothetical protein
VWAQTTAPAEEAQPAEPAPAPNGKPSPIDKDWPANVRPFGLDAPTATDDWFGLGPAMRDLGIDMNFFWNQHYMAALGGGLDTTSRTSATMDWFLTFDLERWASFNADIHQAREQWGGRSMPRRARISRSTTTPTKRTAHDQSWYRHHTDDNRRFAGH